jgi:hypothetical protein
MINDQKASPDFSELVFKDTKNGEIVIAGYDASNHEINHATIKF